MPPQVEDVIADIAVAFHWPPLVMDAMELDELMMWHHKARRRTQPEKQ